MASYISNHMQKKSIRKIFESLGSDVEWIQGEQIILATKDSKIMILKIGDNKILIKDVLTEESNTR